jgi:hypothetical protein
VGFSIEKIGGAPVLRLNDSGEPIANERDASDVMGEIFSSQARFVAIPASRLAPDFFVLRTRLAGEVIQKFVTYGIGVAILGDIAAQVARSDALRDFVRESNRGNHVWFLADDAALEAKLKA